MGTELKKYINDNAKIFAMNKMNEESILHAGMELMSYLDEQQIDLNLDDFSGTNKAVFEDGEQCLKEHDAFKIVSMFSCVLIDLGVLVE